MPEDREHQVTQLLVEARQGHEHAVNELFGIVYSELHSLAQNKMRRESPGNLLQPTALVNETYIRLFGGQAISINDREHFFRLASSAMRRILIDVSRLNGAAKRGGAAMRVPFEDWMFQAVDISVDRQLDLQRAIDALAELDARAAQIVNLTLFAGRSTEELAQLLNVTKRTIERELAAARLFLIRYLSSHGADA